MSINLSSADIIETFNLAAEEQPTASLSPSEPGAPPAVQSSFEDNPVRKGKYQFSIKLMLIWTAIVAGGLAIVAPGGSYNGFEQYAPYPITQTKHGTLIWSWSLSVTVAICVGSIVMIGVTAHVRQPKSIDAAITTAINVLAVGCDFFF